MGRYVAMWDAVTAQMDNPEVEAFVEASINPEDSWWVRDRILAVIEDPNPHARYLLPAAFLSLLTQYENLGRKYKMLQESRDLTYSYTPNTVGTMTGRFKTGLASSLPVAMPGVIVEVETGPLPSETPSETFISPLHDQEELARRIMEDPNI